MPTPSRDRELAAPAINTENKPFFDAAKHGRLLLKRCDDCGKHHYYPRRLCPHCFSARTRWVDASGRGRIYTYSVSRLGVPTPFALAYVTLDEGVRVMTNIVDCDLDSIRIDMPVRVVFKQSSGEALIPMFTPEV